jgi:hypothetical protein
MSEIILILLVIGLLVLIVGIATTFIVLKRKEAGISKEPDYRAFFILGICFLPVGIPIVIATNNPGLLGISALGIIYMSLGLANRDKWEKNK